MKVLQIFPRFPWPLKDGGAVAFYTSLKGLKDQGHEVTAVVLNTSKHYVNPNELPDQVKSLARFILFPVNNSITPFGAFTSLFSNDSYILSRFKSVEFENLLKDLLTNETFDVLIFESLQTAWYINCVRKYSDSICLLRSHNVEFGIWESHIKVAKNPIKRFYLANQTEKLKREELQFSNQFDGILAITESDKQTLIKNGITCPIHYYPVGINLDNSFKPKPHTAKIFHLGSMDWMPNQEAVLWFIKNVWPLISKQLPDLVFEIAGRNMPESFFKLKIHNIKVVGEVENAAEFMLSNGILVIPLLSGSGMRVKVLEGMALGKCIASTSAGMAGIEAIPGLHYEKADTIDEFASKVVSLCQNLTQADEMGEMARLFALETYNLKDIMGKLEKFIESLKK